MQSIMLPLYAYTDHHRQHLMMLQKALHIAGWLIALGGLGLAVLSLLPYVAPNFWVADNMSFFLIQLLTLGMIALIVGLATLALAPERRPRLIYALALLTALLATTTGLSLMRSQSFIRGAPLPLEAGDIPLKIVALNANHRFLGNREIANYMAQQNADVIVIEEASWRSQERLWQSRHGTNSSLAGSDPYPAHVVASDLGDVVVFSRYPVERSSHTEITPLPETGLRHYAIREYLDVVLNVEGKALRLIAMHPTSPHNVALWKMRNVYYDNIARELEKPADRDLPTIVIGDWNLAPWSKTFAKVIAAGNLHVRFPDGQPQTTRFFKNYHLRMMLGAPVDHAAANSGARIRNVEIGEDVGSDHLPLSVSVSLRGNGASNTAQN